MSQREALINAPRMKKNISKSSIEEPGLRAEENQPRLSYDPRRPQVRYRISDALRMTFRQTRRVIKVEPRKEEEGINRSSFKKDNGDKVEDFARVEQKLCEICQLQMNQQDQTLYICDCQHRNSFCRQCLENYVIYKIKNFEEIYCPRQDCIASFDHKSPFFQRLPADLRHKYKKIQNFQQVVRDPNTKLCPTPDCEGLIRLNDTGKMLCGECWRQYCQKCLLAVHSGPCETKEIEFFKENLYYQQCSQCKCIIQREVGCNHMKCPCGYEFCYVCGVKWTAWHYQDHDSKGRLIILMPLPQAIDLSINVDWCACRQTVCDCDDECCSTCEVWWTCQPCQGATIPIFKDKPLLARVVKFPLQLIIYLLFVALMLLVFLKDIFTMLYLFMAALGKGLLEYPCQKFNHLNHYTRILAVMFCPVYLMVGVCVAIRQTCLKALFRLQRLNCQTCDKGYDCIWNL